jgi:hypothetical protein
MDLGLSFVASILMVVLLTTHLPSAGAGAELCVVPSDLSPCPCSAPCHTFDHYLNQSSRYFLPDTAFLFLPGVHEVHSVYGGVGISGMNFSGTNATLVITTDSSVAWFSLTNSASVFFSGLAVNAQLSSLYILFSFSGVSSVVMTNMEIKSNCVGALFLNESSGTFKFQGVTISLSLIEENSCNSVKDMTTFLNVNGLIDITGARYNYSGSDTVLAINMLYTKAATNTTINIADTKTYHCTIAFGSLETEEDLATTESVSIHIRVLLENVSVSGAIYTGIGFGFSSSSGLLSILIINCHFQSINGTTISIMGLAPELLLNAVIRDSQLSGNYGSAYYGVALLLKGYDPSHPTLLEMENVIFESNVYSDTATALFEAANVTMTDCTFRNNTGTALFLDSSNLTALGHNDFIDNVAYEGACLSVGEGSKIMITNETRLSFANNVANNTGAAIYLRTDPASSIKLVIASIHAWCFIHTTDSPSQPVFIFDSNTANSGGDGIFGGNLDFQSFNGSLYYCIDVVNSMSEYAQRSVSPVSSAASRVCLCGEYGTAQCLEYQKNVSVYPGQTFHIPAFTVGQQFGTSRGAVYAQILNKSRNVSIPSEQRVQTVGIRNCTESDNALTYKLGTGVNETLVLTTSDVVISEYPDEANIDNIIREYKENLKENITHVRRTLVTLPLFLHLNTLPCPRGFVLGESGCQCTSVFENHSGRYKVLCNIDTQTVEREYSVWVDATNITTSYSQNCPLLYCNSSLLQVNLSRKEDGADIQCVQHHSGVLCGGCQENYSLAVGSSNCLPHCSNSYLSLLSLFAGVGVILVLFIKYLNLTITQGLISGFILYANIVQTNKAVFLSPRGPGVRVFATLIAWFNLDLGIETCFSEGLDMYTKTWLQFAFPVYLWTLAGGIILACRYSQLATKFFGNNAVHVLATIVLLSYNKLLRVIITVFSASRIQVQSANLTREEYVWTYDGNLPYLSPQHSALFAVSIAVFLFLWLPFTLSILLGQWLQRYNHLWGLRWLGKLRPLFDAFCGPLKDRHHYWAGVSLLARVCVIFPAADPLASNEGSLLTIIIVALALLFSLLLFGKVYRKYYISVLEVILLSNLVLFAVLSLYFISIDGQQEIAVYVSVGFFAIIFSCVVIFQLCVVLMTKFAGWKRAYAAVDGEESSQLPSLIVDGRH